MCKSFVNKKSFAEQDNVQYLTECQWGKSYKLKEKQIIPKNFVKIKISNKCISRKNQMFLGKCVFTSADIEFAIANEQL